MNNIENYKKRFYNLMESTIGDVRPLNEYVFKDNVVKGHPETGASTPSDDVIDEKLLSDIKQAEKISGVKACITTAKDGHRPSGRHPVGHAVDIAMFGNSKGECVGYSGGKSAAINNGIYDNIIKFIDALKGLGYTYNGAEKSKDKGIMGGDIKNIFAFGYPGHENHVHVSNMENYKSDGKASGTGSTGTPQKTTSLDDAVLKNAKLCGWGNDVEGYKKSGWKCPKPETKKTEVKITQSSDVVKQPVGDPYEYKKTKDGRYYTKKKTSDKWIDVTGTKFEEPIKRKVFKEI